MADSSGLGTTAEADGLTETPVPGAVSESHEFQPWRLLLGLLTVTVAVLYLVNDDGVVTVDGQVAGAVLLVIAGAALVIRSALRVIRKS